MPATRTKPRVRGKKAKKKTEQSLGLAAPGSALEVAQVPAPEFVEGAYLDYAMTVILDRALPMIGDGLKPVQRRIIYAMSELGLSAQSKPKKSARTIGDVIGKFHPHGDGACYEAMVLMSQPFSYRYPLVDGHGNWGSIDDPKSFAAMRYTEARLTPYAKTLTDELGQGTVEWRPNFDNTLNEPAHLPAGLPNILLNGSSGIAVGMSTDIPPHNLAEVVDACIALLDKARLNDAELFKLIPGPDFPGGGVICSDKEALREAYATGTGNIRVRARYESAADGIVITEMPYQVSTVRVIEQIAEQVRKKKLPLVRDLRDESTETDPVRIVITPKGRKTSHDALMAHLFATTDLERVCRVNLNAIGLNGKPGVLPLGEMLREWLRFRLETVRKRLEWRLERVEERLEELAGFLIAYAHIDEVIKIIRESDDPQPALMKRFKLSERQAHAILELKLRRLAKLEYIKVKDEQAALREEQKKIGVTLKSQARLKTLVKKELKAAVELYGDKRRTLIQPAALEAKALKLEDLSADEAMCVVVSRGGWVRAIKGEVAEPETLSYQSGDEFLVAVATTSKSPVVFFDETGQCFCAPVTSLPSGKGYGEPLSSRFALNGALAAAVTGANEDELLLVSKVGDAMRTSFGHLLSATSRKGKKVMNMADGVSLAAVTPAPPGGYAAAASDQGRVIAVPVSELPSLGRGKGNRLLKVHPPDEKVVSAVCVAAGQTLQVLAEKKARSLELEDYVGKRGGRGRALPLKVLPKKRRRNIRLLAKA